MWILFGHRLEEIGLPFILPSGRPAFIGDKKTTQSTLVSRTLGSSNYKLRWALGTVCWRPPCCWLE